LPRWLQSWRWPSGLCGSPASPAEAATATAETAGAVTKTSNLVIERINVHAPDKSSGHHAQQVDIIYNFIGILPTPQTKKEAA
jgi:hypothetical protein